MTEEQKTNQEEPCIPFKDRPFAAIMEKMVGRCTEMCANMMPTMMAMCNGAQDETKEETTTETTQKI